MAMEKVLKKRMKRTLSDKVFDTINIAFMLMIFAVTIYPLYFVIIASISDPYAVNQGKTLLLPYGISFTGSRGGNYRLARQSRVATQFARQLSPF